MPRQRCYLCQSNFVQKCHVKDKATFNTSGSLHEFCNIIYLCNNCHYKFFDRGRLAIVDSRNFLLLECLQPLSIVVRTSNIVMNVRQEYIDWKNEHCHVALQVALLRYKHSVCSV